MKKIVFTITAIFLLLNFRIYAQAFKPALICFSTSFPYMAWVSINDSGPSSPEMIYPIFVSSKTLPPKTKVYIWGCSELGWFTCKKYQLMRAYEVGTDLLDNTLISVLSGWPWNWIDTTFHCVDRRNHHL